MHVQILGVITIIYQVHVQERITYVMKLCIKYRIWTNTTCIQQASLKKALIMHKASFFAANAENIHASVHT